MQHRMLGGTGIEVSRIALGGLYTSSFGPGLEQTRHAVHRALELGINCIDTAPGYANSEEVLGIVLAGIDVPLVISTKLGGRPRPFDPQDKKQLSQSVEESLRLLDRDVIDVLFIHEPDRPLQYNWWSDPEEAYGPVVDVLDDLKRRGVVRFTGLGGTTMTEMAHVIRSDRFDVVLTAFNYSALFREAQHEVLPEAFERDMGIVLGRRYDDVVLEPAWLSHARQQQLLAFYELLDDLGLPIVEVCLRFVLSNTTVDSVLIGAKTAEHVEEAVTIAEKGALPEDVLERLDSIAGMVPFRPFEEPMILPFNDPHS